MGFAYDVQIFAAADYQNHQWIANKSIIYIGLHLLCCYFVLGTACDRLVLNLEQNIFFLAKVQSSC
jgi:hypothetical protein